MTLLKFTIGLSLQCWGFGFEIRRWGPSRQSHRLQNKEVNVNTVHKFWVFHDELVNLVIKISVPVFCDQGT